MTATDSMVDARRRAIGVAVGLLVAGGMYALPAPSGLSREAWAVAAVGTLMALWWVAEVLPRAVTALLPLLALPLMGASSMGALAASYAHPVIFLMLGGFIIGAAMQRVGLHERLTAWLLRPQWVRRGPRRVLAALMVAAALISAIVSNTATVLMMLPLALALSKVGCPESHAHRSPFVLGLAYASSIGGMATLVGTPPNAVLAGLTPTLTGQDLGFAQWMAVGVPTVALLLPLAWWSVAVRTYKLPASFNAHVPRPVMPQAHASERAVVAIVVFAMLAWLFRGDKVIGSLEIAGWGSWVGGKGIELDALVALMAAAATFVVPAERTADGRRRTLMTWDATERAIPWSVLLLFGGGFALASAIVSTGLTAWMATGVTSLAGLPLAGKVLAVCLVMTFVTELTSNTATAQIALPVLAEAAIAVDVAPMLLLAPAALSASCAFMMPVATAANAVAAEAGGVTGAEMARAGLSLNLIGALVITAITVWWMPVVLLP